MQQAARDAASKADFLPVTLQLVLVQPAGVFLSYVDAMQHLLIVLASAQ